MSHKFKTKIILSRVEAANRMHAIADAVAAGGEVTLELDGLSIAASLPDTVKFELELEDDELEIELKWEKTAPPAQDSEPSGEPAATSSSHAPSSPAVRAASSPSGSETSEEPVNYGLAGQADHALATTAST
jgi:amphi-Trp domain-containing protein